MFSRVPCCFGDNIWTKINSQIITLAQVALQLEVVAGTSNGEANSWHTWNFDSLAAVTSAWVLA